MASLINIMYEWQYEIICSVWCSVRDVYMYVYAALCDISSPCLPQPGYKSSLWTWDCTISVKTNMYTVALLSAISTSVYIS